MKKLVLSGFILLFMVVLFNLSSCDEDKGEDDTVYLTEVTFKNNSNYDIDITITDKGWVPASFTLYKNGSRIVKHKEEKTTIAYQYNYADNVKPDNIPGNTITFTNK